MMGLGVWGFIGIAVVITAIVIYFVNRNSKRKENWGKPIERNREVPSHKVGDKTIRLPLHPSGSRDSDVDLRGILRQEIARALGKEAEPEPEKVLELKKEPEKIESWSKEGAINAEIVNPSHRTIGFYHVELLPGKDYGRQYLIMSKSVFSLRLRDDNTLEPMPHNTSMEHPTSEVYEAIQTKDDMMEVFGNHDEGDNKLKIGMLVLAACVALFLMFMAVYKGGK